MCSLRKDLNIHNIRKKVTILLKNIRFKGENVTFKLSGLHSFLKEC